MKTPAAFLLAATMLGGAVAHATPFKFQVPEGWTDLSPGAPAANFRGLTEPELKLASSVAFFAADRRDSVGILRAYMSASVQPKAIAVDARQLDHAWAELDDEIRQKGLQAKLLDKSVVSVSGATAARFVFEVTAFTQMLYVLPGDGEHAAIKFSCLASDFPLYRPVFERTAAATVGLKRSRRSAALLWLGVIAALLVAGGLVVRRRFSR